MTPVGRLERKALLLIKNIKAHPGLYKSDDACFHALTRVQKQKLWDQLARVSGFMKTEDAKSKWRSLIIYLRQHLDNVAKKKIRRYIPNTGNPADKYVQVDDWRYYEYIKFMAPYVRTMSNLTRDATKSLPNTQTWKTTDFVNIGPISKTIAVTTTATAQSNVTITTTTATTESAPTPMQLKIGNVIVEVEVDSQKLLQNDAPTTTKEVFVHLQTDQTISITNKPIVPTTPTFTELSTHDQNLNAFFDAMLRSTQRLPKFHQERVKRKLQNAIKF